VTRGTLTLRSRLTLALVSVLGLSLAAFSWVLDSAFRRALWAQFDVRLAEDAGAVATMIEIRRDGSLEFEAASLPGFEAEDGRSYFEVWTDQGAIFARSPSLGARLLGRLAHDGMMDGSLPDGQHGRIVQMKFPPRREWASTLPVDTRVTVVVARHTDDVAGAISRLRLLLWGSGLTAMTLASLAGAFAIERGLVPVGRLSARADAIDARQLSTRLPTDGLPAELQPAVVKLNELLARLEASFERERRFGADASHELRTPLAGLRSTLEVTLSRPRPATAYREAMVEALAITTQMGALVESLLALSRLDRGQDPPAAEPVALADLVDQCRLACDSRFRARRISFENHVARDLVVHTDRERIRMIVLNLLTNAADYTAEGGAVVVQCDAAAGTWLEVADSGPAIPEDMLEKIFDRFFRADTSRSTGGDHWGIGLALVRALCQTLGLQIHAENRRDGWVVFRLEGARVQDGCARAMQDGSTRDDEDTATALRGAEPVTRSRASTGPRPDLRDRVP